MMLIGMLNYTYRDLIEMVCAMTRTKDIKGQKFNRLTAIRFVRKDASNNARWLFKCECGKEVECRGSEVTRGGIQSCGCVMSDVKKTHGMSRTKIYKTWIQMRSRCTNPNDQSYSEYGGRGITVCDEWFNSFDRFYSDMGEQKKGTSIERIDNNKGYSKENCKWATLLDQQRNKRTSKWWYIDGIKYPSHLEAAKILGKGARTIIQWCEGYFCSKSNKLHQPKDNCWSELKYKEVV